jgi:hypothetical protein
MGVEPTPLELLCKASESQGTIVRLVWIVNPKPATSVLAAPPPTLLLFLAGGLTGKLPRNDNPLGPYSNAYRDPAG